MYQCGVGEWSELLGVGYFSGVSPFFDLGVQIVKILATHVIYSVTHVISHDTVDNSTDRPVKKLVDQISIPMKGLVLLKMSQTSNQILFQFCLDTVKPPACRVG